MHFITINTGKLKPMTLINITAQEPTEGKRRSSNPEMSKRLPSYFCPPLLSKKAATSTRSFGKYGTFIGSFCLRDFCWYSFHCHPVEMDPLKWTPLLEASFVGKLTCSSSLIQQFMFLFNVKMSSEVNIIFPIFDT